jgi:hypothetical protein
MGKNVDALDKQAREWNRKYWYHSYPYQRSKTYAIRRVMAQMADDTEKEREEIHRKIKENYSYD